MKTITLKEIPDALHRTYRERARRHARSLNKEILVTLEAAAGNALPDMDMIRARIRERVERQAARRRKTGKRPLGETAFLKAIAEGRECPPTMPSMSNSPK